MPAITKGEPTRVRTTWRNSSLDRRIRGDRRHHRVGAQKFRGQDADDVAAHQFSGLVDEERPVGVAIGRDQRVELVRMHPAGQFGRHVGAHRLGIDRHETVGAAERHHFGAIGVEHVRQQVAQHRGMLPHPDAPAAQRTMRQELRVAGLVAAERVGIGQGRRRIFGRRSQRRKNSRLVGFADLARLRGRI